jgi:hypothetical protein
LIFQYGFPTILQYEYFENALGGYPGAFPLL